MSSRSLPSRPLPRFTAATLLALAGCGALHAADPAADSALQQRVDILEARLKALEEAKQAPAAIPAPATGNGGLSFGAYGEMKFGAQQNPDEGGAWQNGFDGGRLTLLPSYQVGDRLLFKAEIEIEHGGTAVDADDKLAGALEVEQCYLDYTVDEHFHWRLPGIDVVPFGYTNLNHEPTLFYSVQRPELANGLIPTTWFGAATSIHGVLAGPVSYQFQISSSLIDDGGNVRDTSAANGPASPGGYPAGISGSADALGLARPTTDEFKQQSNQLGYTLRLAYSVPAVTGLAGSSSVYFTPDVVPRHAYATDLAGVPLGDLHHCALTMADTELRFRPAHDGIELRAEAVAVWFSSPANLRANNDGDPANNVGSTMWGVSAEVAWHQRASAGGWEFVPFYRYSREALQNTGFAGLDADAPTGSGRIQFHTLGVAVFPAPEVVIKLDYQAVLDGSASGPHGNHVLGGVGFFF